MILSLSGYSNWLLTSRLISTVGSSPTRRTKLIPSHSGDCTRLLICRWKSTVGSSPTGITNNMERVAQLVEHAITLTRILWEISSDVKSYFDLLNPWSQVRALPLSLVMRPFRILSTWHFSSNVINSFWF